MSPAMNHTIIMSIIGGVIGCLISFVFYKEKKNGFFYILFIGYLGAIIGVTLFPIGNYGMRPIESLSTIINIIPFSSNANIMSRLEVVQCALNVVMFMPFGLLFPLATRKNLRIRHFIAICFLFSLSIEVIQLMGTTLGFMWRSFDINDIIFNTLGGSFTYAFVSLIMRCLSVQKRQAEHLS